MLTPVEIQSKTFKSGIGYDKKDVEAFFREVLSGYEFLYKENLELKDKVNTLNNGIQYYKKMENALQNALVLAEKTSEETKVVAQKHAKTIEKEARVQAQEIITNAKRQLERIYAQTDQLLQQYSRYKIQYKQLAASQLELLNSDTFDLETVQQEMPQMPEMPLPEIKIPQEAEQIQEIKIQEPMKKQPSPSYQWKAEEEEEEKELKTVPISKHKRKELRPQPVEEEEEMKISIPEDAPITPVSDRTETLDEIIKSIQRSFAKEGKQQPKERKKRGKEDFDEFEFSEIDD